jgi:hypothetical protein
LLAVILWKVARELETLGHLGFADVTTEASCTTRLYFVVIVGFIILRVRIIASSSLRA